MQIKELGHIVLYVKNAKKSAAFYRDILGWKQIVPAIFGAEDGFAVFSSGRTHHELLLIEVAEGASLNAQYPRLGLYHFGLKVGDSDEDLKQVLAELKEKKVNIVGMSDHSVSHSIYITDPDGNEIELYIDVPGVDWKNNPSLIMAPIKPLRL
jgi:catechol 2,3-dioxygenase